MKLSNKQIKEIRALHQKKYRRKEGRFIVEGLKMLDDIAGSAMEIEQMVLTPSHQNLQDVYTTPSVAITDETTFSKISTQKTASGVLAVVKQPDHPFDPSQFGPLTLLLDGINDPGNLGTIIRTADWFGVRDVICSPDTVDLYNPKTIQSTMGSIARVRVHYLDAAETLAALHDQFTIMGLFMQGEPLEMQRSIKKRIVITGNEANGISKSLVSFIHKQVKIPHATDHKKDRPESLNASIATAIACYELTKGD